MPASSRSGRGGGWVVTQFLLMAVIVALSIVPGDWPGWLRVVGLVLLGAGLVGFAWAVRSLGASLTPYPQPTEGAALVENGPYRLVRHPIYVAGSFMFLGAALATSIASTVGAVLLPVLWHFKAGVEERYLAERFPRYADYRRRVRRGV